MTNLFSCSRLTYIKLKRKKKNLAKNTIPLIIFKQLTLKYMKHFVGKITERIIRLNSLKISSWEESEEDKCFYEELTADKLLMLIQYSIIQLSLNSHMQPLQREKKHIKILRNILCFSENKTYSDNKS